VCVKKVCQSKFIEVAAWANQNTSTTQQFHLKSNDSHFFLFVGMPRQSADAGGKGMMAEP
jgi:hypothetical protein